MGRHVFRHNIRRRPGQWKPLCAEPRVRNGFKPEHTRSQWLASGDVAARDIPAAKRADCEWNLLECAGREQSLYGRADKCAPIFQNQGELKLLSALMNRATTKTRDTVGPTCRSAYLAVRKHFNAPPANSLQSPSQREWASQAE